MTDEPFEGFGPRMKFGTAPQNRADDSRRVIDLSATRRVKERTGQTVPIPLNRGKDSPEMTKHEDEAIAMSRPIEKRKSAFDKAMDYLGLSDPNA